MEGDRAPQWPGAPKPPQHRGDPSGMNGDVPPTLCPTSVPRRAARRAAASTWRGASAAGDRGNADPPCRPCPARRGAGGAALGNPGPAASCRDCQRHPCPQPHPPPHKATHRPQSLSLLLAGERGHRHLLIIGRPSAAAARSTRSLTKSPFSCSRLKH